MDDLISRQQAIEAVRMVIGDNRSISVCDAIKQLPPIQPDISYIISETLHECGIYGEEATVKLIGTLKRLGRDDLLPPCVR